jgi:hypothetical protein
VVKTISKAIALIVCFAAFSSMAQQVSISEISDKRTTGRFFAGLDIKLSVVGGQVADTRGVRRMKLERAVDDTGRNLLREDKFPKTVFDTEIAAPQGDSLDLELSLSNPSRQAKQVLEISGQLELLTPHKDPKSILTFGPLSSLYGKKLALPTSIAKKLSITPMNKAAFDDMRKNNAAQGQDGGELVNLFRQLFSINLDTESLGFLVSGDINDIVAVEVVDAQGKTLKRQSRSSSGSFTSISFAGGPPANGQIRVYLSTPQSVMRIPVQLKGVTLP